MFVLLVLSNLIWSKVPECPQICKVQTVPICPNYCQTMGQMLKNQVNPLGAAISTMYNPTIPGVPESPAAVADRLKKVYEKSKIPPAGKNTPATPSPGGPLVPGAFDGSDRPVGPPTSSTGTPGSPGTPGGPGSPLNPNNPRNPGSPSNPRNPGGPSNPRNPGSPYNPTNPNNPFNPFPPKAFSSMVPPGVHVVKDTVVSYVPVVSTIYLTSPPIIIKDKATTRTITIPNSTITQVSPPQFVDLPPMTITQTIMEAPRTVSNPPVYVTLPPFTQTVVQPVEMPPVTMTEYPPKETIRSPPCTSFLTQTVEGPVHNITVTLPPVTREQQTKTVVIVQTRQMPPQTMIVTNYQYLTAPSGNIQTIVSPHVPLSPNSAVTLPGGNVRFVRDVNGNVSAIPQPDPNNPTIENNNLNGVIGEGGIITDPNFKGRLNKMGLTPAMSPCVDLKKAMCLPAQLSSAYKPKFSTSTTCADSTKHCEVAGQTSVMKKAKCADVPVHANQQMILKGGNPCIPAPSIGSAYNEDKVMYLSKFLK